MGSKKRVKKATKWRRPKLFYKFARAKHREVDFLRVIYPDGTCRWSATTSEFDDLNYFYRDAPCWAQTGASAVQQLAHMKDYDKAYGYETVYLGEL